ncbi:DUF6962 family protein [Aureivirga sp. CE67]|uniref:DUF6962 family protein n=1 Tax=Aureivirga sp. CE67 TaxID=1788983 RepID=UPI0018C94E29|nr:hypothetical protein [Aureivirga sp. CE67]
MDIVANSYDQSAAFTDLIIALLSFIFFLAIRRAGWKIDRRKTGIWGLIFVCISISSLLGAVTHGLEISELTYKILWNIIFLCSGFLISFVGVGALYDFYKKRLSDAIYWLAAGMSILFFLFNLYGPDTFLFFIGYEVIILLLALFYYNRIYQKTKMKWTSKMIIGILLSFLAAIAQTIEDLKITLIWDFDNNGVFHIIEVFALSFMASGVLSELRFQKKQKIVEKQLEENL